MNQFNAGMGSQGGFSLIDPLLERILEDLRCNRAVFSGMIHPAKAISLARAVSKVKSEEMSEALGMSRSYLSTMEVFSKPINEKFLINMATFLENKPEGRLSAVIENYEALLPDTPFPSYQKHVCLCQYLASLEHIIRPAFSKEIGNICFECVTSFPEYFDIAWESEKKYDMTGINRKRPSNWPEGQIPQSVISNRKSLIPAWTAGLISTNDLIKAYLKNRYPLILIARRDPVGFQLNVPNLISLFTFLFESFKLNMKGLKAYLKNGDNISFFIGEPTWFELAQNFDFSDDEAGVPVKKRYAKHDPKASESERNTRDATHKRNYTIPHTSLRVVAESKGKYKINRRDKDNK
jgi:hypothetical protein